MVESEIRDMIAHWLGPERVPNKIRTVTDTTDFFKVDYGDVLLLSDNAYLVRNFEREGRFGIDEEPKFWVRRAVDLRTGRVKVIKMVFHERFMANVGGIAFDCVRSPKKEARILDMVKGHGRFMQGGSAMDAGGNIVRVLDYIKGRTLAGYVSGLAHGHEEYFNDHLPGVLEEFAGLVQAIGFIHERGEKHGDIRRDHVIMDNETGRGRWIDFDFNYMHGGGSMFGYDLFGLGNILAYIVAQGEMTVQELSRTNPSALDRIAPEDMNIVFPNRVMNLGKLMPYIPKSLNRVLLHFSVGANAFYDDVRQLSDDLMAARTDLKSV